jgi:hypothetical protein
MSATSKQFPEDLETLSVRGLQTRDAELALPRLLGDLSHVHARVHHQEEGS